MKLYYAGRRVQLPEGYETAEKFPPLALPDAERPDTAADSEVVVISTGQSPRHLPLAPSLKLRNHSPSGFSWGYGGSGPSQLALAILLDYLGDKERALRLYQRFKLRTTARWDGDGRWKLTGSEIDSIVTDLEEELETEGRQEAATYAELGLPREEEGR